MNEILNYLFLSFLGVLPSFVWLGFYLKKDQRPEPKLMILKIFIYGMVITIPVFFLEKIIFRVFQGLIISPSFLNILNIFLGVALVEEFFKFLVVKEKVLNNPEFDEPVDAMIYMMVVALGFAAVENILIIFRLGLRLEIFKVLILRFLGATFLHTLCSGIIGFFLGLSFFKPKIRKRLVFLGFLLAIPLHGFYNFSILKEGGVWTILIFSLLIGSIIFILFGFKKLKEINKKTYG
jgi:RsiW-degrading membrane proteinase PrsW (M82 family)